MLQISNVVAKINYIRVGYSLDNRTRQMLQLCVIKLITMLNTYNIGGANGSVMVPVLTETGSLMAYLLYPDPQDIVGESYPAMTTIRQLSENYQTTIRQLSRNAANTLSRPGIAIHVKNKS